MSDVESEELRAAACTVFSLLRGVDLAAHGLSDAETLRRLRLVVGADAPACNAVRARHAALLLMGKRRAAYVRAGIPRLVVDQQPFLVELRAIVAGAA